MKFILITILFLIVVPPAYCESNWQLLFQPRQRVVKTIGIYKEQIFIGTGNGVFVSKDNGKHWKDFGSSQLLADNTGNSIINWIHTDEENEKIYIGTSFGSYYSPINKPNWHLLFKSTKNESYEVNSLTIDNNQIYLATNDGFWRCEENNCERLNQGLEPDNLSGNYEVFFSLKNNNNLFLATSNGIYLLGKEGAWQNITNGIPSLPNGRINARHIITDNDENLWTACGTGVFVTYDKGKTWEDKSEGIRKNNDGFKEAFYLFKSNNLIYIACGSGIYYFDTNQNSWIDINDGIRTKESTKNVYWLAKSGNDLYAATDEGLFASTSSSSRSAASDQKLILKGKIETDFANLEELEPSVIEVQKQALKFASLPTTGDYKRYRAQARLRNLIPRIGFDINTTGTNTDYYQFEKGIATDISLNNKFDAGSTNRLQKDDRSFKQLSILWNTNQFVYDDEIREILNQARLTANIKENLLDDVTRIYFQRRKLQLDNLQFPYKNPTEKLTKELEIAELTGQLDSRTGGWFSKETEKRKQILARKK